MEAGKHQGLCDTEMLSDFVNKWTAARILAAGCRSNRVANRSTFKKNLHWCRR